MSRTEERARLIATFVLYGYHPMSQFGKRGPVKKTLLCNSSGVILRASSGGKPAVRNASPKVCARVDNREPRSWDDLTINQLRQMHERLMLGDAPLPKAENRERVDVTT